MTTPDIVWGGLLLAGTAFEAWALISKAPSDTLSETTRKAFRLRQSRPARLVFLAAYLALFGWLLGHLLDWWP